MSESSRLLPLPLLFTFQGTLTQTAIDIILKELDYRYTIERYVEQQAGPFYLKVGGPLTLYDFTLTIQDGQGIPNIKIDNDFKLHFRAPILGGGQIDALPFRLSAPSIRVELFARGSKGYAIFTLGGLKVEVGQSSFTDVASGLRQEIWNKLKRNIGFIQTELTRAINEILREQPFELFDLEKLQIPLGDSNTLNTRVVFDEFGFREDYVAVAVRIYAADSQGGSR